MKDSIDAKDEYLIKIKQYTQYGINDVLSNCIEQQTNRVNGSITHSFSASRIAEWAHWMCSFDVWPERNRIEMHQNSKCACWCRRLERYSWCGLSVLAIYESLWIRLLCISAHLPIRYNKLLHSACSRRIITYLSIVSVSVKRVWCSVQRFPRMDLARCLSIDIIIPLRVGGSNPSVVRKKYFK